MKIIRSTVDPPPRTDPPPGVDLLSRLPDAALSHILSFLSFEDAYKARLLSPRWRCIYPPNPTLLTQFPDKLLRHVLSFLSLKDAYKAKLLSPRWRHLYPPNTSIRFKQSLKECGVQWESAEEFMARVDKFMRQFRAPKIECFEAIISGPGCRDDLDCSSSVNEWIRLACLMKTERIRLTYTFPNCQANTFPFQILSTGESSVLKHLELWHCYVEPFSCLAGPLISLRTLKLNLVSFHQSFSVDDMSAYFPHLENLSLASDEKIYTMRQLFDLCGRLHYLRKLRFESHEWLEEDFEVHNFISDCSATKQLDCLEQLTMSTHWSGYCLGIFLSNLPKEAPRLIKLSIRCELFSNSQFQFPEPISMFKCLKRLELIVPLQTDLQSLLRFLQVAPRLQVLNVEVYGDYKEDSREFSKSRVFSTTWLEERLNP